MLLIIDVMTKNNRSGTNNNQHLKDHLYDSTIEQYSSDGKLELFYSSRSDKIFL